jgi:hypothetical protein
MRLTCLSAANADSPLAPSLTASALSVTTPAAVRGENPDTWDNMFTVLTDYNGSAAAVDPIAATPLAHGLSVWSRGMIPASGAGGPGFKSRNGPFCWTIHFSLSSAWLVVSHLRHQSHLAYISNPTFFRATFFTALITRRTIPSR